MRCPSCSEEIGRATDCGCGWKKRATAPTAFPSLDISCHWQSGRGCLMLGESKLSDVWLCGWHAHCLKFGVQENTEQAFHAWHAYIRHDYPASGGQWVGYTPDSLWPRCNGTAVSRVPWPVPPHDRAQVLAEAHAQGRALVEPCTERCTHGRQPEGVSP